MIQPYFDPTNYFRGGSVFSQYLEGFVKERSAMNKQMMEVALAQADPTFLQKQIQLMNENIIALEKAKAKAQAGDATANKQIFGLVKEFGKVGYIYEREKLLLDTEMGGRAVASLASKKSAVQAALADPNNANASAKEAAIEKLFDKANTQFEQEALKLAIQEVVNEEVHGISLTDIKGYGTGPEQRKTAFIKKYDKDATLTPLATKVDEIIKIAQDRSGAMTPANRQAVNDQIDAAIKKYEDQRAGYEKQLADLQEGGVDPFAGFSRNYMLDNPFIQMSRSQGKVDALAAAIEAAQQEDFRTPFARVERVAAEPVQSMSFLREYDQVDPSRTFIENYEKIVGEDNEALDLQKMFPDLDQDELAILINMGVLPNTYRRKVGDEEITFASPDNIDLTPGGPSVAEQTQAAIEQSYSNAPFPRDSDIVVREGEEPLKLVKQFPTPTADLKGVGTDVMGDQIPMPGGQIPLSMAIGPALTSPVRESSLFDVRPLQQLIDQGQIQMGLSDDRQEIVYTPHTPAAVDALLQQTRKTAGPGQVAYEVLPR